MIDNLTNNPRKREPLRNQWWVPDSKEIMEKMDLEFLAPVRKLNASQKAMFRKLVKENYEPLSPTCGAYENPFYQETKE